MDFNVKFKKCLCSNFLLGLALFGSFMQVRSQKAMSYHSAVHYGFIIPHSVDVQNTAGAMPFGVEAGIMYSDTSEAKYDACKCSTGQGINMMYFNYDRDFLGRSLGVNYFFEPAFRVSPSFQFKIRSSIGGIYLTEPYHPDHNPENQSYSTHLSFFLGLSTGLSWQLNPNLQATVYANYLHTSNGGFKDPNKGINWPTAQFQINYFPSAFRIPDKKLRTLDEKLKYGFTFYGLYSSRLLEHGDKVRYSIFGAVAESYLQLSRLSGLIAGVELYEDYSLKKKMEKEGLEGISSLRSGITAGHVFMLGKIQFTQQLGWYLYSPSPYFDRFYHRWGLNYSKNHKWVIGGSLKAHRHVANFVDVRVGFRLSYFKRT